jgi:peptidoglycan/xylan/chitin deacetylase (PgdA/CDA1 family)
VVRVSIVLALVLGVLLAPGRADAAVPSVQFSQPSAGQIVRGTVTLAVSSDPSTTSVMLEWSKDDGTTWNPIGTDVDGSDGWSEPLDTTTAGDGPVTLRATATTGSGPASATEDVTVDNTTPTVDVTIHPTAFSPNGDGRKDTAHVQVTLSEPSSLVVRVVDADGRAVRTLASGVAAPLGTTSFAWDGRRGSRRAADGRYTVVARATDPAGNRGTGRAHVRLDTRPPRIRWISLRPEPAARNPVTARFALGDASEIAASSVRLLDEVGIVRTVHMTHPQTGPSSIRVPVRYSDGRVLIPGLYRLRLTARDGAGNLRVSRDLPFRVVHPVRATVWREVRGAGRRVALTFDDCNDERAWNRILNILAADHLHATFFCIGTNVARYAPTARRTIRLGDSVGDHTWDHSSLPGRSLSFVENEMQKQADAWWKVARVTPLPYFRPPGGAYDSTTLEAAGRLGFQRVMLWDVDPQDWRRPGAGVIASSVLGPIHPGAIVVLHVQSQTADALPTILAGLHRKHLVQCSLPELFAAAGMR